MGVKPAAFALAACVWAVTLPPLARSLDQGRSAAVVTVPYMVSAAVLAALWWQHAEGGGRVVRGSGRMLAVAIGLLAVPQFFWAFVLIAVVVAGWFHGVVLLGAVLRGGDRSQAIVGGWLSGAMAVTTIVSAIAGFPHGSWWLPVHISIAVGLGVTSIVAAALPATAADGEQR